MDFKRISQELIVAIRGKPSQAQLSQKLGHSFNKWHRWESGRTTVSWRDFVQVCAVRKAPLQKALKEAYSYFGDIQNASHLIRHFIGHATLTSVAQGTGLSRTSLSRLAGGSSSPSLPQMLNLMSFASVDFLRFIEILTDHAELPSIQEQIRQDRIQLGMFYRYPWLSALLSAIDLKEYQDRPSDQFLSEKSKVPMAQVKAALQDLAQAGLLIRQGQRWETALKRVAIRGSVEERRKIAEYVFDTARGAVDHGFGNPAMRFSWKLFSLNQSQYEKMLQKYTELFNELGTLVDQGQDGADKVYLFSAAFVDYDLLPPK